MLSGVGPAFDAVAAAAQTYLTPGSVETEVTALTRAVAVIQETADKAVESAVNFVVRTLSPLQSRLAQIGTWFEQVRTSLKTRHASIPPGIRHTRLYLLRMYSSSASMGGCAASVSHAEDPLII